MFIDCGSSDDTPTPYHWTPNIWRRDEDFINTGKIFLLRPCQDFNPINSLRFFPDGNRNCCKLPLETVSEFLFLFLEQGSTMVTYDGLSRPPSFKLETDGNLWANVTSSTSQQEPVYHEAIYRTVQTKKTTVCLVRTRDDEVPFLSSLKATYIPEEMYEPLMENRTAFVPRQQDQSRRKQS